MSATRAAVRPAAPADTYEGNDRVLLGIVAGVLTFWMFAGTVGTIARAMLTDINGGPIDQIAKPLIDLN